MRLTLALAVFCLTALPAAAETVWHAYTGNTLRQMCESEPSECEGYIIGIVDARYTDGAFCLTGNANREEIAAVVTRYLEEHPDYGNVDASALIVKALAEQFPCG